jgi:hypothetical protein
MIKNYIILGIIILTILINCFLVYGLLWNPYTLFFDRPEFSTIRFNTRETYAGLAATANFLCLLMLTILMILKFKKKKRLLLISPLFSGLTMFLLFHLPTYYPDSETQYTREGYQYIEQRWYLDNNNVFKRFKSDRPLSTYSDDRTIIWHLDSLSKTQ